MSKKSHRLRSNPRPNRNELEEQNELLHRPQHDGVDTRADEVLDDENDELLAALNQAWPEPASQPEPELGLAAEPELEPEPAADIDSERPQSEDDFHSGYDDEDEEEEEEFVTKPQPRQQSAWQQLALGSYHHAHRRLRNAVYTAFTPPTLAIVLLVGLLGYVVGCQRHTPLGDISSAKLQEEDGQQVLLVETSSGRRDRLVFPEASQISLAINVAALTQQWQAEQQAAVAAAKAEMLRESLAAKQAFDLRMTELMEKLAREAAQETSNKMSQLLTQATGQAHPRTSTATNQAKLTTAAPAGK